MKIEEQAIELRKEAYNSASKIFLNCQRQGLIESNFHELAQKLADKAYWALIESSAQEVRIRYLGPNLIEFQWSSQSRKVIQLRGSPPPGFPMSKRQLEYYVDEDGWTKELING